MGTPLTFACPAARRERDVAGPDPSYSLPEGHATYRTGRTKQRPPARALGARSLFTAHEFVCACGRIGWSTHEGVLRRPELTGLSVRHADRTWRIAHVAMRRRLVVLRDGGSGVPLSVAEAVSKIVEAG